MTISKITRCTCLCGFDGEVCVHRQKDDSFAGTCPKCRCPVNPASAEGKQRFHGNRRFAGEESVSVTEGVHPKEVKFARKHMPKTGHCIDDHGIVRFPDRATQRQYKREMADLKTKIGVPDDPRF